MPSTTTTTRDSATHARSYSSGGDSWMAIMPT